MNAGAPASRVAMLAVDGLDWALVSELVDAGAMPFVDQMLSAGASARFPSLSSLAPGVHWVGLATGVPADEHGVVAERVLRADGVTAQLAGSGHVRQPPLWQRVGTAGWAVHVAGWPGTWPAALPAQAGAGSAIVAEGFHSPEAGVATCWPMAPDAVAPMIARADVQDARVHPDDLDDATLAPLLAPLAQTLQGRVPHDLLTQARQLLAAWASVHNLGVHWAMQAGPGLLALRFAGLPAWQQALQPQGLDPRLMLRPWYRYLDLMIGRYMGAWGPQSHLLLLWDQGLPPRQSSVADRILGASTTGGLLMTGPGVPADTLWHHRSALDIAPTVLGRFGLPAPVAWAGRDLLAQPAAAWRGAAAGAPSTLSLGEVDPPAATDVVAQAWLTDQGVPEVDLSGLQAMARRVRARSLAGWGAARLARGRRDEAITAWQRALSLVPEDLGLALMLGEALLDAGRADACRALVTGLPAEAQRGIWPDVVAGLIAHGAQDWTTAALHFSRVQAQDDRAFNAPLWLARAHLAQGQADLALAAFTAALQWPGDPACAWEGLAAAQMQRGQPAQAVEALTQAVALQPCNARLHAARALGWVALGEVDQALAGLWQALHFDPNHSEAQRWLATLSRGPAATHNASSAGPGAAELSAGRAPRPA